MKAVNKPEKSGHSPLTTAAMYGWAAIVDQLIKNGARPEETKLKGGVTALFKAAELGQVEVRATGASTPWYIPLFKNQTFILA